LIYIALVTGAGWQFARRLGPLNPPIRPLNTFLYACFGEGGILGLAESTKAEG